MRRNLEYFCVTIDTRLISSGIIQTRAYFESASLEANDFVLAWNVHRSLIHCTHRNSAINLSEDSIVRQLKAVKLVRRDWTQETEEVKENVTCSSWLNWNRAVDVVWTGSNQFTLYFTSETFLKSTGGAYMTDVDIYFTTTIEMISVS